VQHDHHDDEAEDRVWRAIVENYGERPQLDDPPVAPPDTDAGNPSGPATGQDSGHASDAPFGGRFGDLRRFSAPDDPADPDAVDDREDLEDLEDEDRYVPPDPPPVPRATPDRLLAWAGVFGSPLVLLASLLLSFSISGWIAYLLVGAFVGGFVYLVVKMPREPRDPWDDGAQV
jgi:hypothetical protein